MIHQYICVQEFDQASKIGVELLNSDAYSQDDVRIILHSFVLAKQYELWMRMLQKCQIKYPNLGTNRDILEDFAQQILSDGMMHPSTTVRAMTILSVGLAGDFRLVPLVIVGLKDDHELIRILSLQVSLQYGTEPLKQIIYSLAKEDESIQVRVMAYQVAALLGIQRLAPYLQKCSSDVCVDGVERREAWKASFALTSFLEDLTAKGDVEQLGFICDLLRMDESYRDPEIFLDLLAAPYPEIQEHALLTLTSCCQKEPYTQESFVASIQHIAKTSPFVKIRLQAAAILYLQGDVWGKEVLIRHLQSSFASVCEAASEVICSLGAKGKDLAQQFLPTLVSQKASVNLAILLLVCRDDVERSGDIIAKFLVNPEFCWAVDYFLFDNRLQIQESQMYSLYSHMIKREIGRRLIRLLALSKYSKVKQVTTEFLSNEQQQGWSFFSGVFWEEGDEQESESLKTTHTFATQLEAVLAALHQKKDDVSIQEAIHLYASSRWQDKLTILESIAFSENTTAIPFLLEHMFRESPSLQSALAGVIFALFK